MFDLHGASRTVSVKCDKWDKDPWEQKEANHGTLNRLSTTALREVEVQKRIKEVRQVSDVLCWFFAPKANID